MKRSPEEKQRNTGSTSAQLPGETTRHPRENGAQAASWRSMRGKNWVSGERHGGSADSREESLGV